MKTYFNSVKNEKKMYKNRNTTRSRTLLSVKSCAGQFLAKCEFDIWRHSVHICKSVKTTDYARYFVIYSVWSFNGMGDFLFWKTSHFFLPPIFDFEVSARVWYLFCFLKVRKCILFYQLRKTISIKFKKWKRYWSFVLSCP